MRLRLTTLLWLAAIAGCGGGGGGGGNQGNPPAGIQSVGGVWVALTVPVSTLTLLIAETGEMRVMAEGPSFGAGAVIVTNGNEVTGSYQTHSVQAATTTPPSGDLDCSVQGTVTTRSSLQLTVSCTDQAGASTERQLAFFYDATYDTDSSLAAMAGNYTLDFRPATNTLNINADGTVFGMFDNGPQCLLNGTVEIIDPQFDLYRLTLSFANCTRLTQYEGVTMTGFARRAQVPKQGDFFALVTGVVDGRLQVVSVLYTPV